MLVILVGDGRDALINGGILAPVANVSVASNTRRTKTHHSSRCDRSSSAFVKIGQKWCLRRRLHVTTCMPQQRHNAALWRTELCCFIFKPHFLKNETKKRRGSYKTRLDSFHEQAIKPNKFYQGEHT
jgi:hypothetical protein